MSIQAYINGFIDPGNSVLAAILDEEKQRDVRPCVGPQVGCMLGLLVHITGAQRVLEFGTCLGYSALWLADALRETSGCLTTVELEPDLVKSAREYIQQAGLDDYAKVIEGDAARVVKDLEGPFDLILQDSAKFLYPEMLEDCIRLLRPRGILVLDDALFKPMDIAEKFAVPVHRANQLAFDDPRLYCTLLPIGDGLLVGVKKA